MKPRRQCLYMVMLCLGILAGAEWVSGQETFAPDRVLSKTYLKSAHVDLFLPSQMVVQVLAPTPMRCDAALQYRCTVKVQVSISFHQWVYPDADIFRMGVTLDAPYGQPGARDLGNSYFDKYAATYT